ncbi:hypothetical protein [Ramlibacter sp.]|uniref:hypothetical protein n=1 Tax=Ramlibacter sp. TaxID=1917967 RepID=UPI003D0F5B74
MTNQGTPDDIGDMYRSLYRDSAGLALPIIEGYERKVMALACVDWNRDDYSEASAMFDALEAHVRELPGVQQAWIEALISRAEFTQALWRAELAGSGAEHLARCEATHRAALRRLAQQCRALYGPAT